MDLEVVVEVVDQAVVTVAMVEVVAVEIGSVASIDRLDSFEPVTEPD